MPILKCLYRQRPSDDLRCGVMPVAGETLCPRHKFLAEQDVTQERAKEVERRLRGQKKPSAGPMPNTREHLLKAGYLYTGTGECASCGERMEWWKTPNLRPMPFNPMPEMSSHALSHFATCKHAARHRRAS